MTGTLTFDEMVRELTNRGVPRNKAEHAAGLKLGQSRAPDADRPTQTILALPVTIVVPWSCLVSDNAKYGATIRAGKPLIVLKPHYRESKDKIRNLARRLAKDSLPADGDLELTAAFVLPDRRIHDITNFAKIVADALEGVIYNNDSQLAKTSWWKSGVEVDSPRAVITVRAT